MLQGTPRQVGLCEKTTSGGEDTFGKQVLSLTFSGNCFKTASLSLATHLLYILERFYIAKWAIREWRKKTLLVHFESCLKPFMDCIL